MKKTLRITSFLLAALFVVSAFCGCGLFGKNKTKMPEKQIVDHVYKYEKTEVFSYEYPDYSGDSAFTGYTDLTRSASGAAGYAFIVEEVDKNYNTVANTLHMKAADAAEETLLAMEVPAPAEEGKPQTHWQYVNGLSVLPDGVLLTTEESDLVNPDTYEYTSYTRMRLYGFDGTLRAELEPKKIFNLAADDYLNLIDVQAYEGDLFMRIYTDSDRLNSNAIYRIGMDGTVKGEYEFLSPDTDGGIEGLYILGNNKLCAGVSVYGNTYTQKLVTVDMTTGQKTEVTVDDYYVLYDGFTDGAGNLYYADENSIRKFDPATGAKTECMNFINSDYLRSYGTYAASDDEHFSCLTRENDDRKVTLSSVKFEKVPDEQITPKYLITVASSGYAYDFQKQIIEFNLASDEYRIKYMDYTQYNTTDDYDAGATKLKNDIISGNVPDILIANMQFSAADYVSKGLFADLYTFIDNDPDFDRKDFLQNILTGCEIGGKLYELPTHVSLYGLAGKKELIDEYRGLTMRAFADKVKTLPEGVSFFRDGDSGRDELLQTLFFINYVNFLDPATGRCSLDNDDFKAMLEYVKSVPEKSIWQDMDYDTFDWEAYDNMYKDGKAIAMLADLSSFDAFQSYFYTFGNTECDIIGVPAPDGDGLVFSTSNLKFLISEKSLVRDAAWDFVKIFFEEKYQTSGGWAFPITVKALDKMKQTSLDNIKKREEAEQSGKDLPIYDYVTYAAAEKVVAETTAVPAMIDEPIGGAIYDPYPETRRLTAEDVEKVYHYVTTVRKQLIYDEDIFDIVSENASAYFAGQKTLDQVASLTESSINIKLSESR